MFNQHLIIMKKQVVISKGIKPSKKAKSNYLVFSHLLSPLELLAIAQRYQSFTYRIGNRNYQISQDFCYYLQAITKAKKRLFTKAKPSIIKHQSTTRTKNFARFIHSPLTNFRLPKRLIHQLQEQEIYTMSQVLLMGIHKFSKLPYLKQSELDTLMRLLAKNDSLTLFLRNE
jgi:hypothetical protein